MWIFLDALVFTAGFASCWLSKDKIIAWTTGAEALAKSLEARASAIRAVL